MTKRDRAIAEAIARAPFVTGERKDGSIFRHRIALTIAVALKFRNRHFKAREFVAIATGKEKQK